MFHLIPDPCHFTQSSDKIRRAEYLLGMPTKNDVFFTAGPKQIFGPSYFVRALGPNLYSRCAILLKWPLYVLNDMYATISLDYISFSPCTANLICVTLLTIFLCLLNNSSTGWESTSKIDYVWRGWSDRKQWASRRTTHLCKNGGQWTIWRFYWQISWTIFQSLWHR